MDPASLNHLSSRVHICVSKIFIKKRETQIRHIKKRIKQAVEIQVPFSLRGKINVLPINFYSQISFHEHWEAVSFANMFSNCDASVKNLYCYI